MAILELKSPRARTCGIWAFRLIIVGIFLPAGTMKLISLPMTVREFDTIGLGQWFRYLTGALELTGALVTLVPNFSSAGALILLVIDIGAFLAQIMVLHMGFIHTVVIGALLVLAIAVQRISPGARKL